MASEHRCCRAGPGRPRGSPRKLAARSPCSLRTGCLRAPRSGPGTPRVRYSTIVVADVEGVLVRKLHLRPLRASRRCSSPRRLASASAKPRSWPHRDRAKSRQSGQGSRAPSLGRIADACLATWLRGLADGPSPAVKEARRRLAWRVWSGRRDSNSRPPPWQGGALPLSYFRWTLLGAAPAAGRPGIESRDRARRQCREGGAPRWLCIPRRRRSTIGAPRK
jgi:hypothetical protein